MKILIQILVSAIIIAICGTAYFYAVNGLTALFSPPQEWEWVVKLVFFLGGLGLFAWAAILGCLFFSGLAGAWYDNRFGYGARARRKRHEALKNLQKRNNP